MKYNLTFWQKLSLPFAWLTWLFYVSPTKKTWHEVKKGMEPHEHKYTIVDYHNGYKYWCCEHEGCNYATLNDPNAN